MLHLSELSNEMPLSRFLNDPSWDSSPLGELARQSNSECYLKPETRYYDSPPGVWRVVHAFWHPDDELMTRFIAYGPQGELRFSAFGVHYNDIPTDRLDVTGSYKYGPEYGNEYLLAVDGRFLTPNRGGYTVQVLDEEFPSESFIFGLGTHGRQHKCLVIGFRLFMA